MTRFQKQVLIQEEIRQKEEAQNQHGGGDDNPTLNARNPKVGESSRRETVRYKNNNEMETENQVEFVDAD